MSNFSITIYKLSQQCRYDKAKGNEWDKTINTKVNAMVAKEVDDQYTSFIVV